MSDERTRSPILAQLLATDTIQDVLREAVGAMTEVATLRAQITNLQADHDALLWRVVELEAEYPHKSRTRRDHRQTSKRYVKSSKRDDYVRVDMETTPFVSLSTTSERYNVEAELTRVRLPAVFEMQRTPITRAQWHELAGVAAPRGGSAPDNAPATGLTLLEALWFCNKRSEQEGLRPCYVLEGLTGTPGVDLSASMVRFNGLGCDGYRLPVELEWEAAARVGSVGVRPSGLDGVCWHQGNSEGRLHAVALKSPNALGLYDMLGNTHELVWGDWLTFTPPSALHSLFRDWAVCRSGSFSVEPQRQHFASRWRVPVMARREDVGFRPVRTIKMRRP